MISSLPRYFVIGLALTLVSFQSWADDTNTPPQTVETTVVAPPPPPPVNNAPAPSAVSAFQVWMAGLTKSLPFLKGLDLNPQLVSSAEGKGSTFGMGYKYEREFDPLGGSSASDLSVSLHSDGIFLADPRDIPHNVFTHSLKLSWINIWPQSMAPSSSVADQATKTLAKQLGREEVQWSKATTEGERTAILTEAYKQFDVYSDLYSGKTKGALYADDNSQQWFVRGVPDSTGHDKELGHFLLSQLTSVVPRPVFLSADLGGDIEHDQSLTNVQFVGDAQIRGKLLYPAFDLPFRFIRKLLGDDDGTIKDWHNLAGGPLFWGGIGIVDASQNKARTDITTEHENFPRVNAGLYYRNELIGSADQSLALELNWNFYYEVDAPAKIRATGLDATSYFKATVLYNMSGSAGSPFVEYSTGRLPLDVSNGQTVAVGWRLNF